MQLRIFTEPQHGASYETMLAVARCAEEEGFDAFFRSDHYLEFIGGDGLPGPSDAWLTLAALGRETTSIRLGTLVSPVTFRSPGPMAVAVAQADAMSGGRVELGLGSGWFEAEHRAYGFDFPPVGERFARLEEQLQIIQGLWTVPVGERFTFTGEHYRITDSPGLPKPVQRPHPPLIIGGAGTRRTPRLAARYADEFNAFMPPERAAEAFARVRGACEADGRDPATMTFSVATTVCCADGPADLERRAVATGQTLEQLRGRGMAVGAPAEVVELLETYATIGATRVYLQVLDMTDLDHVRLLAAEVMPHVR